MLSFEMKTMNTLLVLSFMLVEAHLLYINERSGQENLADLTYDNTTMNLYNVTEVSLEYSDGGTVSLLERMNGSETDATPSESDEVFKETKRLLEFQGICGPVSMRKPMEIRIFSDHAEKLAKRFEKYVVKHKRAAIMGRLNRM